jgi:hypothetical protein
MTLNPIDHFAPRHIGPSPIDTRAMLDVVGAASLDALIDEAIPARIRLKGPLDLPPAEAESQYLSHLKGIARKNSVLRSFIGLGYYDTLTPSVIRRNLFENPGWYTPYTPYQAEIAQGRLESLLNFQTMVTELTGMEVANASLLDEGTAAGEAMTLLHRVSPKKLGTDGGVFLVSDRCYPHTIGVLRSRAEPLGIELQVVSAADMTFDARTFGVLLQYPDEAGRIDDVRPFIAEAHKAGVLVAVASDLLALALITPPGEMGADVRTRRFLPARTTTCGTCLAASSACRSIRIESRPTGWRCRRANSTFAGKRRRRTSAPHRRFSPTWPRCMPSITVPRAFARLPSVSITSRARSTSRCERSASGSRTIASSTRCGSRLAGRS